MRPSTIMLRAAGVEVVSAAAALVHDLPAGAVLPEGQAEAAPLQAVQQLLVRLAVLRRHELVRPAVDREGEGGGEQVLVLEGDVLVVERVGRLRLLQADDEGRAALDQRHFRRAGDGEVLRHVVPRGAGAEHQRALALPVEPAAVAAGMPHRAAEFLQARQVRHDRRGADAVGEDDVARAA